MDRHLWLIGMMGSGKTAAARELAQRWSASWFDTDAEVVERTGCSIVQLWGQRGEDAFRAMEKAAVRKIADLPPSVIATGGGAVIDEESVTTMRESGGVVWLSASPEVLRGRVGSDVGRPLLGDDASQERLESILNERLSRYSAAADLIIDVDGLTLREVVDKIEAQWNES